MGHFSKCVAVSVFLGEMNVCVTRPVLDLLSATEDNQTLTGHKEALVKTDQFCRTSCLYLMHLKKARAGLAFSASDSLAFQMVFKK